MKPARKRTALPYEVQVRVFRRDRWLCRWCHRPVVFSQALKLLARLAGQRGHVGPLAYYDTHWTRRDAPLLDHLGAVVDHVDAFSRGGAHDESNFVTSCNKCNARKNNIDVPTFQATVTDRRVKGTYGEPEHWDGLSSLFVLLARDGVLSVVDRRWLRALTAPG